MNCEICGTGLRCQVCQTEEQARDQRANEEYRQAKIDERNNEISSLRGALEAAEHLRRVKAEVEEWSYETSCAEGFALQRDEARKALEEALAYKPCAPCLDDRHYECTGECPQMCCALDASEQYVTKVIAQRDEARVALKEAREEIKKLKLQDNRPMYLMDGDVVESVESLFASFTPEQKEAVKRDIWAISKDEIMPMVHGFVDELNTDLEEAQAKITAARALHEVKVSYLHGTGEEVRLCRIDLERWPCRSVAILEGEK